MEKNEEEKKVQNLTDFIILPICSNPYKTNKNSS